MLIIFSASLGSRQKMPNAWSKIGRCSSRESRTADMVQYQSSRRGGNWPAPAISSAVTQSHTRSGPMRRPAARSSRAKCMTFSASLPGCARCGALAKEVHFLRQLLDGGRRDDGMLAEIAVVVALDVGQRVDVIDHQARGARHALLRT